MHICHVVQLTTDNTDVFAATKAEEIPAWARRARLQVCFSDTDLLFDFDMGGVEFVRQSGPHITGADNIQEVDFRKGHIMFELDQLRRQSNVNPILNINVVTAGAGTACIQYEN